MVTLRPAEQKDAASIRTLVRQARINPTGLAWQRFVIAVSDSGEMVGCVQIKPHSDGTHELASLAVRPEWREQGVARVLIEHMLAAHSGPLYLMCRSTLVGLYTKFGFTRLQPAEMPPYYRRMHILFEKMQRLFRRSEALAIMRRD